MLQLTLFGTFEARCHTHSLVGFATDKTRALLAYLALHANMPLRREVLAGMFWPEYPEAQARQNLRQTVYRLRQALNGADDGLGKRLLQVTKQTVRLEEAFCAVDVVQFGQATAFVDAHEHEVLARCDVCVSQLETAVSLVNGELLAGFSLPDAAPFEEWLLVQREHLRQQFLLALHQLTAVYTQRGEYEPALLVARRQIEQDPLREEAYRQMIFLLAINGRKSEALTQYQACCAVLQTELGVSPAPETEKLYVDLMADKLVPLPGNGRVVVPRLHHFPALPTPLIGRQAEVAEALHHLQDPACRLLTIMGLGGVGKTTLAVAVAQAASASSIFADGIYFVPLAGVADAELLAETIARQLGLKVTTAAETWAQIKRWLVSKDCLLVLDNFEHLLAGSTVLAALLTAVPRLKLLITSRESLRIRAEQRLLLTGLDFPDEAVSDGKVDAFAAVALFVRAARRVRPAFQVTPANAAAVVRICQLVQGMPLALELAAAWLRLMESEQIVTEVRRNLDFLTASLRDLPDRHRSMQAVFAHSWQLLTSTEQSALIQLAYFRSSFSLDAALVITQTTPADLAGLIDKSLLQRDENGRYTIHTLLHQFAEHKLATAPDLAAAVAERHSHYYLTFIHRQEPHLFDAHSADIMQQIYRSLDNIHLAWRTASAHHAWALLQKGVEGLSNYYLLKGPWPEAEALFTYALSQMEQVEAPPILYGLLLEKTAVIYTRQGRYPEAADFAHQLLALGGRQQDHAQEMRARMLLGRLQQLKGNYEDALAYYETAVSFFAGVDDKNRLAQLRNLMGSVYYQQGKYEQTIAAHQQALTLSRDLGNIIHQAVILGDMGNVYTAIGDFEQALNCFQQALDIDRAVDHRDGLARNLHNMGRIYLRQGNHDEALHFFQQSLTITEQLGMRRGISLCLNSIGIIYKRLKQFEQAQYYYERALDINRELGLKEEIANNLGNLANVYKRRGQLDKAEPLFEEALQIAENMGHSEGIAAHLGNLATLYQERGEWERALSALDRAFSLLRQMKGKYLLAHFLLVRAKLLLDLNRSADARLSAAEGLAFAEEIGHSEMIADGNALLSKIDE